MNAPNEPFLIHIGVPKEEPVAPNEGREEKQPWTYDVDVHGTAFCFYKHNDFKFKATEPDLCKVLNEHESFRDQLSKEREFNDKLKQGLENGSERWKKHLELENNTLKEQLAKEREMRKENLKQAFQAGRAYEARRIDGLPNFDEWYESLISKASELDKN